MHVCQCVFPHHLMTQNLLTSNSMLQIHSPCLNLFLKKLLPPMQSPGERLFQLSHSGPGLYLMPNIHLTGLQLHVKAVGGMDALQRQKWSTKIEINSPVRRKRVTNKRREMGE